jgi:hypothetical protein
MYIIFQNIKCFTTDITIYVSYFTPMVNNKDKFRLNSETVSIPGLILSSFVTFDYQLTRSIPN